MWFTYARTDILHEVFTAAQLFRDLNTIVTHHAACIEATQPLMKSTTVPNIASRNDKDSVRANMAACISLTTHELSLWTASAARRTPAFVINLDRRHDR
jgi:hypothetical protein